MIVNYTRYGDKLIIYGIKLKFLEFNLEDFNNYYWDGKCC